MGQIITLSEIDELLYEHKNDSMLIYGLLFGGLKKNA